jgi:membrane protein DedA with SNARE-associated domain
MNDPVGAALLFIAPLGVLGVFVLALTERLVPVLPSGGLFMAIGVAAAEGLWSFPMALLASVIGGASGAAGTFQIGAIAGRLHRNRLRRLLRRRGRLGETIRQACRQAAVLPFAAQLVPATRTLAPLAAGVIQREPNGFLLATAAGLTLWNLAFITAGFVLVRLGAPANATVISLALSGLTVLALIGGRFVRSRTQSQILISAPFQRVH